MQPVRRWVQVVIEVVAVGNILGWWVPLAFLYAHHRKDKPANIGAWTQGFSGVGIALLCVLTLVLWFAAPMLRRGPGLRVVLFKVRWAIVTVCHGALVVAMAFGVGDRLGSIEPSSWALAVGAGWFVFFVLPPSISCVASPNSAARRLRLR